MQTRVKVLLVWVVAAVLPLAGCESTSGEWEPVLETVPPAYLEEELGEVAGMVAAARAELAGGESEGAPAGGTGDAVVEELAAAGARLEALVGVYVPLYRAMVEGTNAYRLHQLGREAAAVSALERVDAVILEVSRETGGELEGELERISAEVARARVALEGGSSEAGPNLKRLAETLSDVVTRAGLLL